MIRYISILFSLISAFNALSQKPYVELIVQPSDVEVGEAFSVKVKSNISGEINIDFPANYDQGYNVMNSMEQDFDGNTGEITTFYFHARSGSISKEGKYTIGPAYVRKGNKVYRSNKVQVNANPKGTESDESVEASLYRKPACGTILLSKDKVYQGEPVLVQSKVTARFKPTHYDAYQSYAIESGADQHKLSNPQEIIVRNERKGQKEHFIFELDKQVVFFNNPGKFKIDPFEMTLQSGFDGFHVSSKRNYIRVVPLPKGAPTSFVGGVGDFDIKTSFDRPNLKQGEITTLTLEISGKGNLHDLSNPKLVLPAGLKIYGDPERKEKFTFTEKGADGYILIDYHLQVLSDTDIKFPATAFSYFNPVSEKYITKFSKSLNLIVAKDPTFTLETNDEMSEKSASNSIQRYNSDESTEETILSHPIVKWIGISAPFCIAFLFFFFRTSKPKGKNEKSNMSKKTQEVGPAQVDFNEWLSILQSHVDTGNSTPFFTQLSKNLQNSVSQAARGDLDWVLSKEEIKEFFTQKDLSAAFQNDFFTLQQTCELCRYGCQVPDEDLNLYMITAKSIFSTLNG